MTHISKMSDVLFLMFVITIPSIFFLFLLWSPTVFIVIRQQSSKYPRNRIFAYALTLELVTATGLAFLVNWVGLLNPAAYAFIITITIGVLGAVLTNHFAKT